ncbi:LacI family DNA-binding transcriptional regulator [Mesorhizobium sp. ES1-1]|uniref:LacI family DNA-binding transcriptional regulator n=1 Tax=Mesorhizobium sp. ES1-1 TaxID=2876629 RepID=UPI001CCE0E1D|nr:LacI family DNA-binding transcriptional regulator [Mesorhizobium sp. ES1-1]MBZ9675430.1 LacI family transcriptional regulator [Mesorhizobium sp. ES1-1]
MKKPTASTIRNVAHAAGVSVTTVSRHLNGRIKLPAETSERIRSAVAKLEYRPNALARRLSKGRSETIGLIVSDISYPLFAAIASAAEEEASRLGYSLVTFNSRNMAAKELAFLSRIDDAQVDGILLMTNHPDDGALVEKINACSNVVLVDEDVPGAIAPRLFADNRGGAGLATAHLVENGHTAIAFVGGPQALLSSKERFGAFEEVLNNAGVDVNPDFVFFGEYDEESGLLALQRFATLDNPPTAIFASGDMLALGILQGCRKLGILVPADLSLVSFDDIRNVDLLDPPLTTVHQSAAEFGRRAVGLLVDHVNGADMPDIERVAVELVVRQSVSAPRKTHWKSAGNALGTQQPPSRAGL